MSIFPSSDFFLPPTILSKFLSFLWRRNCPECCNVVLLCVWIMIQPLITPPLGPLSVLVEKVNSAWLLINEDMNNDGKTINNPMDRFFHDAPQYSVWMPYRYQFYLQINLGGKVMTKFLFYRLGIQIRGWRQEGPTCCWLFIQPIWNTIWLLKWDNVFVVVHWVCGYSAFLLIRSSNFQVTT